jgi:hypothetical protein
MRDNSVSNSNCKRNRRGDECYSNREESIFDFPLFIPFVHA